MQSFQLQIFQENLLTWFDEYQRPLPWRDSYRPYDVWISEIMLQQTQVVTMLPYFKRWMETLPSIRDLAESSEDQVLKLWEGLGYYSRARNLRKAAQIICEKHSGEFPEKYEEILDLPGVGRYTAGAVSSIAFNQDQPVVDGNVVRVICRLMDFRDNPKSTEMVKKLWNLATEWIPSGQARFFNQALMELGATVCLPKQPTCLLCPAQDHCQSWAAGSTDQVPAKVKRAPLKMIETALGVIWKDDHVLIQKRQSEGLMGGLWEFPNVPLPPSTPVEKALIQGIEQDMDLQVRVDHALSVIKHGYTSFKVTLHCFLCTHEAGTVKTPKEKTMTRWLPLEELKHYSFPAAHAKIVKLLATET